MGMNLVVLASGRGSNFVAIAEAIRSGKIPAAQILALLSNRANAPALREAERLGIPTLLVESKRFVQNRVFDRIAYEKALEETIAPLKPDYICLAGYTLLLGESFIRAWPDRILNIHPSLLPSFKGLHAQKQALDYGAKWTGCTVHLVTPELDAGPILAQSVVEIRSDDTETTLTERLLPIEHATYVNALNQLSQHQVALDGRRANWKKRG